MDIARLWEGAFTPVQFFVEKCSLCHRNLRCSTAPLSSPPLLSTAVTTDILALPQRFCFCRRQSNYCNLVWYHALRKLSLQAIHPIRHNSKRYWTTKPTQPNTLDKGLQMQVCRNPPFCSIRGKGKKQKLERPPDAWMHGSYVTSSEVRLSLFGSGSLGKL